MAQQLPNFHFERGLQLRISPSPGAAKHTKAHDEYLLIGRLEDGVPFLLHYSGGGVTSWLSPVTLGTSLRRKILGRLRTEVRYAATRPTYLTLLDFAEDASLGEPVEVVQRFHETWRAEYLGERDEDYLELRVPYSEKDEAKRLGACWDPGRRTWKVRQQVDMRPFSRWL